MIFPTRACGRGISAHPADPSVDDLLGAGAGAEHPVDPVGHARLLPHHARLRHDRGQGGGQPEDQRLAQLDDHLPQRPAPRGGGAAEQAPAQAAALGEGGQRAPGRGVGDPARGGRVVAGHAAGDVVAQGGQGLGQEGLAGPLQAAARVVLGVDGVGQTVQVRAQPRPQAPVGAAHEARGAVAAGQQGEPVAQLDDGGRRQQALVGPGVGNDEEG